MPLTRTWNVLEKIDVDIAQPLNAHVGLAYLGLICNYEM